MNKIVLGFPYDGALIWMLNPNQHPHKTSQGYQSGHPYYQRLYGPEHFAIAPKAASLCVLYDEVILAPADAGLPDYHSYETDEGYFNPHLGLRTSWADFDSARSWLEEQVRRDLEIPGMAACLSEDPNARRFILERTNLQILLSLKYDAKILAGANFFEILSAKFGNHLNKEHFAKQQTVPLEKPELFHNYFDMTCLEFNKVDYDGIVSLRSDSATMSYAKQFNRVLDQAAESENPAEFFSQEMKSSMQDDLIGKQVAGAFKSSGTIVSTASLWPPFAQLKLAGLALKAGGFGIDAAIKRSSWIRLAPQMLQVLLSKEIGKLR